MNAYRVVEIFHSLQGEGLRTGTTNVFVRFSGCNLRCNGFEEGEAFAPICDTEFSSGVDYSRDELVDAVCELWSAAGSKSGGSVILTGGEPTLQLDADLVLGLKSAGMFIAVETNGTREVAAGVDWITLSPKTAEHTLVQPRDGAGQVRLVDELKYVRHCGQGIPKPSLSARNWLISPAFEAHGSLSPSTLAHCIALVKQNPPWRLSLQMHKLLGVR